MRSTVDAVLFDYGNVLSAPQDPSDTRGMPSVIEASVEDFWKGYWRYRTEYDLGATPSNYWTKIAADCGCRISAQQVATLTDLDNESWGKPNHVVVAWVGRLRVSGIRVAILSNMPFPLRDFLMTRCPWLPEFDVSIFSCELGIVKPEAAIYRHCVERIGVTPSRALFIDDRAENVDAARGIGLRGIVHSDPALTSAELVNRFQLQL